MAPSTVPPESFARAVAALRSVVPRPEIQLEDLAPPQRLAPYAHAIGGIVTQTTSTRFGDLAGPPSAADLEIRASWTPLSENPDVHLEAWCALLASTAGLPPPGVTALPDRLSHRG